VDLGLGEYIPRTNFGPDKDWIRQLSDIKRDQFGTAFFCAVVEGQK